MLHGFGEDGDLINEDLEESDDLEDYESGSDMGTVDQVDSDLEVCTII